MNAPASTTLDDPLRAALDGPQSHLAVRHGAAVRYHPDVAPFLAPPRDAAEWDDAAILAGPRGVVVIRSAGPLDIPETWTLERELPGVQMVLPDEIPAPVAGAADVVRLADPDVDEMLALVGRTKPGPFARRTHELGAYLGIHDPLVGLAAMAGERMHPPGACEISAVCTDPAVRGHGFATQLVFAVAAGIRARGETPFLHAAADNTTAIRLYSQLGFQLRARPSFVAVRAPQETKHQDQHADRGARPSMQENS